MSNNNVRTVGSLFTGIGGMDKAFQDAGFQIEWQVEIDDYCIAILDRHWPGLHRRRDIRDSGADNLSAVDVVCGGFPCQDISVAGKGKGIKEGTRSGLWFEFARIIGELRPRYVFIENVPAITTNGGTTVLNSLAVLGYAARWHPVSASDVGAPQGRKRWLCVAYAPSGGQAEQSQITGAQSPVVGTEPGAGRGIVGGDTPSRVSLVRRTSPNSETNVEFPDRDRWVSWRAELSLWQRSAPSAFASSGVGQADASSAGLEIGQGVIDDDFKKQSSTERSGGNYLPDANRQPLVGASVSRTERFDGTAESRLGGIFDGLPSRLDAIRRQSRWPAPPGQPQFRWEKPRTTKGGKNRAARLKVLGSAVVPQVIQPFAEGIWEALEAEDRLRFR